MSANLPAPHDQSWFAEWISSGKVPGAVKAIAHLIGSVGNAGAAWINIATVKGEQLQQDIKNETEGRKNLYVALSKAAQKQAIADPAMVDRTMDRLAGKALRAQANLEAVALKVAENLDEGQAVDPHTPPPDDDWLDFVTSHAERANAEKIRDTWAKVIAGEIRKPGSFSFRTLQFLSVLDQATARRIEAVLALVCNESYVPCPDRFDFKPIYPEIKFARECGILNDVQVFQINSEGQQDLILRFGDFCSVTGRCKNNAEFHFPHMPLTVVGQELYSLIKPEPTIDDLKDVGQAMYRAANFERVDVQVGRASTDGHAVLVEHLHYPEAHVDLSATVR